MFESLRPPQETEDELFALPHLTLSRVALLILCALLLHALWAAEFVAFETEMTPLRFAAITLCLLPFAAQGLFEYRSTRRASAIFAWILLAIPCIPLVLLAALVIVVSLVLAGVIPVHM